MELSYVFRHNSVFIEVGIIFIQIVTISQSDNVLNFRINSFKKCFKKFGKGKKVSIFAAAKREGDRVGS